MLTSPNIRRYTIFDQTYRDSIASSMFWKNSVLANVFPKHSKAQFWGATHFAGAQAARKNNRPVPRHSRGNPPKEEKHAAGSISLTIFVIEVVPTHPR